jgi:hypothetical protein
MTQAFKSVYDTDWESQLEPHEKATRKEGDNEIPVVLLKGLQRLARRAGIVHQNVEIKTPSDSMVQAIYTASFMIDPASKGTGDNLAIFVGAADCNTKNTKGVFATYPTAVAESRAEARCLRKALGISTLSSEEIGFRENIGSLEASPTGKADKQLVVAIEKLCESRGFDVARVLEEVITDKARAASIFELTELTVTEAQAAMSWLNEQKPSKAAVSTKDARDARKAELKAKAGEQ